MPPTLSTDSLALRVPHCRLALDGLLGASRTAYAPLFCPNTACAREIFAERLPTVVAPYARRTNRLTDVFLLLGFALGGEAGKRLAAGMGLATSPDMLLRLIRAQEDPQVSTPRILGVDDFLGFPEFFGGNEPEDYLISSS